VADSEKINENTYLKTVLISPLDWGLGHTTRCIPIISSFLKFSCKVVVACNSAQKKILINEFPNIEFVPLQGYKVKYGQNKIFTKFGLLIQIPKILTAIKEEHRWIDEYIQQNKVDLIISDNRYGFYNRDVPSILMTHQLHVHTGFGGFSDDLVSKRISKMIRNFSICWVPDYKGRHSIAGKLSNPSVPQDILTRYLGPLTRFQSNFSAGNHVSGKLLIILSGPEPQRSKLEGILLRQLEKMIQTNKITVSPTIVRGVDPLTMVPHTKFPIEIINFSASRELENLVHSAEYIICRSGYSSLMDLLSLNKKLILIPTPGQGEQEYLGKQLHERGYAFSVDQGNVDLESALLSLKDNRLKTFPRGKENFEVAVNEVMQTYLCSSKSIS
jgi:UDP-N-acetylglucosamine transferase subunit ALG13